MDVIHSGTRTIGSSLCGEANTIFLLELRLEDFLKNLTAIKLIYPCQADARN